jgi:uncharacterized membrane protein
MESLVILVGIFLLAPYVIGIWANTRAGRLERAAALRDAEIARLRSQIEALRLGTPFPETPAAPMAAPAEDAVYDAAFDAPEPETGAEPASADLAEEVGAPPPPPVPPRSRWASGGWERQIGAVLPVWIGGIAIAFAGFYLVKYSIENQLVGPEMRVILGLILGVALIIAARWMRGHSAVSSAERIAQSLAGAGIAVLYVSIYAATALYTLIPSFLGFLGMAATTVVAVVLALRHGPPIALLGMVGGFLTPALIGSNEPNALLFFTYLYFIFAALMVIIRQRGWWLLAWPAVIFAFGWALTWIFAGVKADGEGAWLGLFLVAIAGTVLAASRERYAEEIAGADSWRALFSARNRTLALNVLSLAGAMAVMAVLSFNVKFGLTEWGMFAILAVGAVALAFFDPRRYGYAPWAAMGINALMLAGWVPEDLALLTMMLAAFGALYVTSGFLLVSSASTPLLWATLSAAAALGYYLIAYFRLLPEAPPAPAPHPIDVPPSAEPVEPLVEGVKQAAASVQHGWAVLAMGLALLFFGAALRAAQRFPESAIKERVLAVYALATSAFVALALFIELDREVLSVAIAAEMLAVAWVATKTRISTLRPIAGLLGLAFAFLLAPQIMLLLQLAASSLLDIQWQLQDSIPIVDYPSFQLGLPALFFLAAAYGLRGMADGPLVRTLEFASLALITLWGFYTTSSLFHPGENVLFATASFLERAVITNVLFAFGVACLVAGRIFERSAFVQAGVLLSAAALFRIVYFDLLLKNPLWYPGEVAGVSPFDALTVAYALPILWAWLAAGEILRRPVSPRVMRLARYLRGATLVLAFTWVSLEIRKFYQGPALNGPETGDAEFYTYSAVWLLFGGALLFYGTLKGSQFLRYASLAVVLLTVSKVFLLDAENLTGLYRVFSFFGLGLSLLAISYFYGRFVFGGEEGQEALAPPGG